MGKLSELPWGVLWGKVKGVGRPRCPTYPRNPISICGLCPRAAQYLYLGRLGLAVPSPLKRSGTKITGNGWPEGAGRDPLLSQTGSLFVPTQIQSYNPTLDSGVLAATRWRGSFCCGCCCFCCCCCCYHRGCCRRCRAAEGRNRREKEQTPNH